MPVIRISFSVRIGSLLESSFPLGVAYFKGLLLPLIIFSPWSGLVLFIGIHFSNPVNENKLFLMEFIVSY